MHDDDYHSLQCYSFLGRPFLQIDMEYVEFLRGLRFGWTKIADMMDVSHSTLYRRLEEHGIDRMATFSSISDAELDNTIEEIKRNHPNDGERMIIGHLSSLGIRVPRSRVRSSIHRVDPINVELRRNLAVRRRVYHSDGPNSVWHLDGHHKMVRWRLIIHGGIDGFSRSIVYLNCTDNNRAETVLQSFVAAVEYFGLPNRVRTDCGGENVDVWRYMTESHSTDSAVITGSSVHNERIKRLWRDVFRCVVSNFYETFYALETQNLLNPLNEVDLYCLHQVYMPKINRVLKEFVEDWNNHSLSTERSLTPNQLFVQGIIQQQLQQSNTIGGQVDLPVATNVVDVPNVRFSPCCFLQHAVTEVIRSFDSDNHDNGVSLFQNVVTAVGCHLSPGCNICTIY